MTPPIFKSAQEIKEIKPKSLGEKIDFLIRSDLNNWYLKEVFFSSEVEDLLLKEEAAIEAFQQNRIRNKMITDIDFELNLGSSFHFRNYHNY